MTQQLIQPAAEQTLKILYIFLFHALHPEIICMLRREVKRARRPPIPNRTFFIPEPNFFCKTFFCRAPMPHPSNRSTPTLVKNHCAGALPDLTRLDAAAFGALAATALIDI